MADDSKRLRASLESAQGRARELERVTGRSIDRLKAMEAELRASRLRAEEAVREQARLREALADSERAFAHAVQRLEERDLAVKQLRLRIRELEGLLQQRTKDLVRTERQLRNQ